MGILQMSVQAGLLIAAILLIRAVALYRLPKTSFLVLWGVVLARMLLPVSISSRWSVYSLFGRAVHTSTPAGRAVIVLRDAAQVQGQLGNTAEHAAGFPVSPLLAVWLGRHGRAGACIYSFLPEKLPEIPVFPFPWNPISPSRNGRPDTGR